MRESAELPHYDSYLLRLWQVEDYGITKPRITLIHVVTGQKYTFTEFEGLVNFLNKTQPTDRNDANPLA